jgi:hypothetical protein
MIGCFDNKEKKSHVMSVTVIAVTNVTYVECPHLVHSALLVNKKAGEIGLICKPVPCKTMRQQPMSLRCGTTIQSFMIVHIMTWISYRSCSEGGYVTAGLLVLFKIENKQAGVIRTIIL